MPRLSKTDRELGWLRSLWEEMAQCELIHGGYARVIMKPSATRGVFAITLEIERPETEKGFPMWKGAQTVRYPNGQRTEYLGWLWGQSIRFGDYAAMADVSIRAPQEEHS